jgi:hypothetical protein
MYLCPKKKVLHVQNGINALFHCHFVLIFYTRRHTLNLVHGFLWLSLLFYALTVLFHQEPMNLRYRNLKVEQEPSDLTRNHTARTLHGPTHQHNGQCLWPDNNDRLTLL